MSFFSGAKNFKNKLTRIGTKEPLNFFSIVLILGLDLFVLVNLFQGLDLQTRQLEKPYNQIPYECLDFAENNSTELEKEKIVFKIFERKADFIGSRQRSLEPECLEIFESADSLYNNTDSRWKYDDIQNWENEISGLESEIYQLENDYDTMLLEEIAEQKDQFSIIEGNAGNVKEIIRENSNDISTIELRINNTKKSLMASEEVLSLLGLIEKNKETIVKKNKSLNFWYPIKKTAVQFIFLLPVLILFIFLYRRSLKKQSELLVLIFAHLLVVVSIPIIFQIFDLVFELVPFHILSDIINLLEDLNLIGIWNYVLILLGIGITIGLIYFVQKKLFSKERLYLKRIAQKKCYACGVKLNENVEHCYNCGEKQITNCPHCKEITYKTGTHCVNCGLSLKEEEE